MVEFAQDRILERNPCNVAFQQSQPHQITAWQAPVQDAYKVNFDGAVFADEGLAGLGVVIRNDHGLIMASLTQQIPLPSSVIKVEVLAARKALELIIELGFDNITLEGDSEVLIKSLVKGNNSLAHMVIYLQTFMFSWLGFHHFVYLMLGDIVIVWHMLYHDVHPLPLICRFGWKRYHQTLTLYTWLI